jgi:hypothetical protein
MYHPRVHLGDISAVRVKIIVEKNTDWFAIVLFNVNFQVRVSLSDSSPPRNPQ